MAGALLAGNANGWLGAGGDSSLAVLGGLTGVVEVSSGVPFAFSVPANQIPFGRSANDGLLAVSSNLTFTASSQTLSVLGAVGNASAALDRPAIQLVKGSGNTTSAADIWGGAVGSGGEFLLRIYQYGDKPDYAGGTDRPKIYVNNGGYLFGDTAITLSGDVTGFGQNYRVNPPSADNAMLKIWSDVAGPVVVLRCTGSANQNIIKALDRSGNQTGLWGEYGLLTLGDGSTIIADPTAGTVTVAHSAAAAIGCTITNISGADGAEVRYTAVNDGSKTWIMQLLGSGVTGTYGGITKANATFLYSSSDDYAMLATTRFHVLIGTATLFYCEATKLALFGVTPQVQGAVGATLTNNITAGGTTNQLDDWGLVDYATDKAAIRNASYQLGLKLATIEAKLKLLGAVKT